MCIRDSVEAGLAIAELIAGMNKPTVSLVLGGGHSIGVPLAVSARQSFIAPSATMTIHPAVSYTHLDVYKRQLMARNPYGELLPCHRVVSASGELSSRSFRQEQARRLRAEGVEVVDFRVDLSRYGWDGRSRS